MTSDSMRHGKLVAAATAVVSELIRSCDRPNAILHLRGNLSFLHEHLNAADLVVHLRRTAQRITNDSWTISGCDPALALLDDNNVHIILHPKGSLVQNLSEVPAEYRIFTLENAEPFAIHPQQPYPPAKIAKRRVELEVAAFERRAAVMVDHQTKELLKLAIATYNARRDLSPGVRGHIYALLKSLESRPDIGLAYKILVMLGVNVISHSA